MKTQQKLDNLRVATPCAVGWDSMSGNAQVRFCDHCKLNVYNISELTRTEAEQLIATTEGGICGRIYRRADGTVITRDCPIGLRALRRKVSRTAAAVFALIGSIAGVTVGQGQSKRDRTWPWEPQTKVTKKQIASDCEGAVVTGLVLDPNGAVVPGAKIKLINLATHDLHQTESTDEGKFKFPTINPGRYSITIEYPGFDAYFARSMDFDKTQATEIEVTLKPSPETVTVGFLISDFPVIDTTKPGGTTRISSDFLRRLP